jgi:hypothetical protein
VSRGPHSFRQQDVRRAIAAARRAGLSIARVEVDPKTAKITVVAGAPSDIVAPEAEANPWDTAVEPPPRRRKKRCASGPTTDM